MSSTGVYEHDFYAWAAKQVALLRAGRFSEADVENIAEEIENIGRNQKRELVNRLIILMTYLLKWQIQLEQRNDNWWLTIYEQRLRLTEHLKDNPSLERALLDEFATAYHFALLEVQKQTGLGEDTVPVASPWTAEQVMTNSFMPD